MISDVEPDIIGVWVVKWFAGPLLALAVIAYCIHYGMMQYRCQRLAEERGYLESTYVPNRPGSGAHCKCQMKQNPEGTIDETATVNISLD